MHNLNITKSVDKFLKNLKPKQFRQILQTILRLRLDPHPHDSKQLIGSPEYKRVDMGEFRIIYRVESDVVKIVLVGKSNDNDVYKRFKRLSS